MNIIMNIFFDKIVKTQKSRKWSKWTKWTIFVVIFFKSNPKFGYIAHPCSFVCEISLPLHLAAPNRCRKGTLDKNCQKKLWEIFGAEVEGFAGSLGFSVIGGPVGSCGHLLPSMMWQSGLDACKKNFSKNFSHRMPRQTALPCQKGSLLALVPL